MTLVPLPTFINTEQEHQLVFHFSPQETVWSGEKNVLLTAYFPHTHSRWHTRQLMSWLKRSLTSSSLCPFSTRLLPRKKVGERQTRDPKSRFQWAERGEGGERQAPPNKAGQLILPRWEGAAATMKLARETIRFDFLRFELLLLFLLLLLLLLLLFLLLLVSIFCRVISLTLG